jgi:hypothetical protein
MDFSALMKSEKNSPRSIQNGILEKNGPIGFVLISAYMKEENGLATFP